MLKDEPLHLNKQMAQWPNHRCGWVGRTGGHLGRKKALFPLPKLLILSTNGLQTCPPLAHNGCVPRAVTLTHMHLYSGLSEGPAPFTRVADEARWPGAH